MADKLIILMVDVDPLDGRRVAPVLVQAAVAAAMEFKVELILSGRAGVLAQTGVAERITLEGDHKTVYDLIRHAHACGVAIKLSSPLEELWGDAAIPEIDEIVGDAYVISEAMDDDTVTFTY